MDSEANTVEQKMKDLNIKEEEEEKVPDVPKEESK